MMIGVPSNITGSLNYNGGGLALWLSGSALTLINVVVLRRPGPVSTGMVDHSRVAARVYHLYI